MAMLASTSVYYAEWVHPDCCSFAQMAPIAGQRRLPIGSGSSCSRPPKCPRAAVTAGGGLRLRMAVFGIVHAQHGERIVVWLSADRLAFPCGGPAGVAFDEVGLFRSYRQLVVPGAARATRLDSDVVAAFDFCVERLLYVTTRCAILIVGYLTLLRIVHRDGRRQRGR